MKRTDPGDVPLTGLGGRGAAPRVRRVRRGVDAQLTAQRALGHLEPVDSALVALARTLADAIDEEWAGPEPSSYTVATVAGKLAPILLHLRGERRDDGASWDDELERLRAALRDAAGSRPPDPG